MAERPEPGDRQGTPSIDKLRLWQRVHVRVTLIFAAALLVVLTPAVFVTYRLVVDSELDNLWARIRATAISLAELVDGDRVAAITRPDDAYRIELAARFTSVQAATPELASVYLFKPTDRPEILTFVVDVDSRTTPGQFGDAYDATGYPELRGDLDRPVLEQTPVEDAWGLSVSGFAPVRDHAGRRVAILGVDVEASRVEAMKRRLLETAVFTYFGAFALLMLAALGVARMLRTPMLRVIRGTEAITEGRLDARVGLMRDDEFGVLGSHFDAMAAGLEEREHIRQTFGRYVSEEVAKKLLSDRQASIIRGEARFVTVLFTDLRGYSTISAHLDPSQILSLMNEYLEGVSSVIDAHGGCIIEYLGDGVLTVFGAPEDVPGHTEQALRCALAMNERLEEMNAAWDASGRSQLWKPWGIERMSTKTGIHCGPVVAGSLGSKVRMKYTILGDAVNIAARLEALNATLKTDLLVSREVLERLPPDLASRFSPRGDHVLKGRTEPVTVFSLDLN